MRLIDAKPAKQHLYEIVFDDGTSGFIDKTVWEHSGLAKGVVIDPTAWDELCRLSQTHRAHEKALYYLSMRDHGQQELIQKLCRAGIERPLAEETVQRLVQSGLVDDYRIAAALAREMSTRKVYPKRRVAAVLREKGFAADVIDDALSQLPAEDEQQALELLIKKRYNGTSGAAAREKALAQLARYGFSYRASKRALELWEERFSQEDID